MVVFGPIFFSISLHHHQKNFFCRGQKETNEAHMLYYLKCGNFFATQWDHECALMKE